MDGRFSDNAEYSPNREISLLKQSIQLKPTPTAYQRLAQVYANNYQRKTALEVLTKAVQLYPDDFDLRGLVDRFRLSPDYAVKPWEPPHISYPLWIGLML